MGGHGSHNNILTIFFLLQWHGGNPNGPLWFIQVGGVVLPEAKYQEGVPLRGGEMGFGTL